jgi:hypothetical protein
MNHDLRVTVSDTVYHQRPSEETFEIKLGYSRYLTTEEQPFQRTFFLTEEKVPFQAGWLEKCSLIVIQNRHIPAPQVQLSVDSDIELGVMPPAENADKLHVIEISFGDASPVIFIPAGESARFPFADFKSMKLRSSYGSTRCTTTLIPE